LSSSKEKIFFVPHGGVAAIFRRKSCGSGSGSVSGSVSGSGSGSGSVSGSGSGSVSGSGSTTLIQISTFLKAYSLGTLNLKNGQDSPSAEKLRMRSATSCTPPSHP
jgi:hypothetical protein